MYKCKITIFTPTYNRAHLLKRLYRSIQQQTYRNFEWLIVDDGSSDNTEEVVNSFINDKNDFTIRYFWKNNGGKSRAVNYGLDLAEGELFFIMDSDDYLTEDALEKIIYWESTIQGNKMFCGVTGNRGTSQTETPNVPLPDAYMDVSVLEKYKGNIALLGEHAEVLYTDIFRKFKYPEFEGEKYLTPCIAFDRMAAAGYKVRYFQDIIWVCKYLDDGLTKNVSSLYLKNPYGYGLTIHERLKFCKASWWSRFVEYYRFYCELHVMYSYDEIAAFLNTNVMIIKIIEMLFTIKRKISD